MATVNEPIDSDGRLSRSLNSPLSTPLQGVLLLNKPVGLTSNTALQSVKHLLGVAKAGHAGTLDKLASGMLVICLNEATKFIQYLITSNKSYRVLVSLGVTTTTGDAEGSVVHSCSNPLVSTAELEAVLTRFQGTIEQYPPMFSAVHYQGKRLYTLARQGITVKRQAREVTIHRLALLDYLPEVNLLCLDVHCSKGTYIRSLVEDIGRALGCGAHVAALHRYQVFPYNDESAMIDWQDLSSLLLSDKIDALVLPIPSMFDGWLSVYVSDEQAVRLQQGQSICLDESLSEDQLVCLYQKVARRFLGIGRILADRRLAPKRLLSFS